MMPRDVDLEDQVRAMFRDHEYLADGHPPTWSAPPAAPRPRIRMVIAAAASVLVVASVWLLLGTDRGSQTPPAAPVVRSAPDPHVAIAQRWVSDAVTRMMLPPGAQRRDKSPVAELGGDQPLPADFNTVTVTRWFVAPGTVEQTESYLLAHPPAGLNGQVGGGTVYKDGRRVSQLVFTNLSDRNTAYTGAQVTVSLFRMPKGVAMRLDAMAVWLPTRGPSTQIPLPVSSVQVVDQRGAAVLATRTITGQEAQDLANIFNAAPAADPRPRSCPASLGPPESLKVDFHSATRTTSVVIGLDYCYRAARVEISGRPQSPFVEGQALASAVQRLLEAR